MNQIARKTMMRDDFVAINGVQYKIEDFSEDAQNILKWLRHIDESLSQLQQDVQMHQVARTAYLEQLLPLLPSHLHSSGEVSGAIDVQNANSTESAIVFGEVDADFLSSLIGD